jgi:stage II sporulation protein D
MKARFLVAILLLIPTGAFAQPPEVTVRLDWLSEIAEARLSPREGGMSLRPCAGCKPEPVRQSVTVRVTKGRLHLGDQPARGSAVEILGSYRVETAENTAADLDYPLEIRAEKGHLALVARIPLEEYVAGILAGESRGFASDESLKAMSVAARTYAVRFRARHRAEGFDFCDTTHCQDLRLAALRDRLRAAAEATEGELLWHQGRPAATFYHAHCGGTTEAVEHAWPGAPAPYLRQQPDTFCAARERGEWRSEVSRDELQRALSDAGVRVPRRVDSVEITLRTPSGRAARLRVTGETSLVISAEVFRLAVGRALGWTRIRSDLYDIYPGGERFILRGFGRGHGVGLCQAGAARMGESGKTYRDILSLYYPGTLLGLTAQGLHWQALRGERVEVLVTRPEQEGFLVGGIELQLRELERMTGWTLATRPQFRVYPTVEVFRNAAPQPGWVAASTEGRVIRLQPIATLRAAGSLESTLRHELLHLLVESRAHPELPTWFREGIVLALSETERPPTAASPPRDATTLGRMFREAQTQEEMRRAYQAAREHVSALIRDRGRAVVLSWVERGLPQELREGFSGGR